MINIQDRIFIDIQIDGNSLSGANLVSKIALVEAAAVGFPSILMELNDTEQELAELLCLTDANEILVSVGKSPEDLKTVSRQYRVFNVKRIPGQSGSAVRVLGIYDAPKFTTEAASESYAGTSTSVLKQLADKCKLDYDGPEEFNGRTTNDNQIWLCTAKTRASFAQHVVSNHAYMDDNSAMYAAVTSLGVLKFRNVMDVVATPVDKIKYLFLRTTPEGDQDQSKQVYIASQAKETSQAGLMNAMHNYGSTLVTSGPQGTQIETKVDVVTGAPFLAINDQVSQTVGRTRIDSSPLDCGNVHDKYYRAFYQNVKQLALFSERMSLLVTEPTEVQLLDPVIYRQADADPMKPTRASDVYVVIGKTVYVAHGSHYCERLDIARMSITEKGEADLKASEPTIARESSVPETFINPSATVAADSVDKAKGIVAIVGPIEDQTRKVGASITKAFNGVKSIQPSVANFTRNMRSYLDKPAQAARDIRNAARSFSQLKSNAQELRNSMRTMAQGIRQGNIAMVAGGLSQLSQTSAYFRPDGIASNVCSMFGITQVMQTTAQMCSTVSGYMQTIKEPLDAIEGIGQDIDGLVSDMTSVVSSYTAMAGDLGSAYNSLIYSVTGSSPNLSVPNIAMNRLSFESMIRESISPVTASIQQTSYLVPAVSDVQTAVANTLNIKDDTRNYLWVPETGYTVTPVRLDTIRSLEDELDLFVGNAERQFDDFLSLRVV